MGRPSIPVADRLFPRIRVDEESGCWNWTGATDACGYGCIRDAGRMDRTHRVTWRILVGSIAKGLQLDHLCMNKLCCNPGHLEAVTAAVNTQRARVAGPRPPDPRRPIVLPNVPYDACTTMMFRLRHYSADLHTAVGNGRKGRAFCGTIAYTAEALADSRHRLSDITELPPCRDCARRTGEHLADITTDDTQAVAS